MMNEGGCDGGIRGDWEMGDGMHETRCGIDYRGGVYGLRKRGA